MTMHFKTREEYDQEDWERFRQKQKQIFEKRRARFEAEGYKCKFEGCGQSFREVGELYEHNNKHQEELREAMICNQANCGIKFEDRKKYFDHIQEHKVASKRKIINSIRAVLMYNKHGLLIESFEREYRSHNGKPVPYKFLGHDSLFDLLVNIPEVVQMFPLSGGQHLLLAVPDEKTQHVAKAVGNQVDRVDGFNRKTAEVISRVGKNVKIKIQEATGIKDKQVSNYVKKQFVELLESDEHIDGILLSDLPTVYYKEFGYKIDFDEFGFQTLEEFCFHGLADCVDMDLDKLQWKIVEKGMLGNTMSINTSRAIPEKVKKKVCAILEANPLGLTEEEFKTKFAERHKSLNFRDFCSKSLLEFLCSIPECVRVGTSQDGQYIFFPSKPKQEFAAEPDQVVQELSSNILELLDGHNEGVNIAQFIQGYEGYFGDIQKEVGKAGVKNVRQLLELCDNVCKVSGDVVLPLQNHSSSQIYSHINVMSQSQIKHLVSSLHRILSQCKGGQVPLHQISQQYRDICGDNLDFAQLGFQSLEMLMKHIVHYSDKVAVNEDILYSIEKKADDVPVDECRSIDEEKLEPGWVKIVTSDNPDTLCLQLESSKRQLKELESKMETFYTWNMRGEMVDMESVKSGDLVASLYTDLAWHRARVVTVQCHQLELEFVDWGWRARVRMTSVRKLDSMFLTLPQQSVHMKYKELDVVSEVNWEDVVREGRGRGRVTRSANDDLNIELFMRVSSATDSYKRPLNISSKVTEKFRKLIFDHIKISK